MSVSEEEVLRNRIGLSLSTVRVLTTVWIDAMLDTEKLPEGTTEVAPCAAYMNRYDFSLRFDIPDVYSL